MKRIEANDPAAMWQEGLKQLEKGDYRSAFEYWTKAAELGYVWAHYHLALIYHDGEGTEKDVGKEIHHLEEAAIGGHAGARYDLGCQECENGQNERAVKHFIIAATQGEDKAIKALMVAFKQGCVSKDDLAVALRAHKAAVDATKSPQRKEAEAYYIVKSMLSDCWIMYRNGQGFQKDDGKYIHYLEEAAIGGHPLARYDLGV